MKRKIQCSGKSTVDQVKPEKTLEASMLFNQNPTQLYLIFIEKSFPGKQVAFVVA